MSERAAGGGRQAGASGADGQVLKSDAVFFDARLVCTAAIFPLLSCSAQPDPNTLVMIIESSPTNLDPRVGQDAQSERIDNLIFDDLLERGDDLNVAPGLAERWEIPDPLTYVFHLHHGVKFHDGRPLTARDVKWTLDSLLQGKIRSTKDGGVSLCRSHRRAGRLHGDLSHEGADAALLWNLSDGAMGIVPYGSGDEMTRHPWVRGRSSLSARRPIERSSSNATTIIGARRRSWRGCDSPLCRMRPRRHWNCGKAAPTWRLIVVPPDTVITCSANRTLPSSAPRELGWLIWDSTFAIPF